MTVPVDCARCGLHYEAEPVGGHRVLCGDSTDPADIERLMAGSLADMVWTDPPYGVAYQTDLSPEEAKRLHRRSDGKEVANDALKPKELEALLRSSLGLANDVCRPGACWFLAAPAGPPGLLFTQVLADLGILRETLIWVKDRFAFGRSDYHYRHEPVFYGWKPGAAHQEPPDRTQDTVWEIPRPARSEEHPTMKPVELVARAVRNHTQRGGWSLTRSVGPARRS